MRGLQRRTLIRAAAAAGVAVACTLGAGAGLRSAGVDPAALLDRVAAGWRVAVLPAATLDRLPRAAAGTGAAARRGRALAAAESLRAQAAPVRRPAAERSKLAARQREQTPASGSGAIVLDGFRVPPGAVSGSAQGFDPAGPRALVLWRVDAQGATRLAEGHSDAAGALHFPQVAEPGDPLTLVVAPAGAPPPSRESSDPTSLSRKVPLAPVVEDAVPAAGGVVLRIAAREATGAVLVASGDGTLLGRFAVPPLPAAAARVLEVAVPTSAGAGELWIAQELSDGRLSAFEPVALPAPAGAQP